MTITQHDQLTAIIIDIGARDQAEIRQIAVMIKQQMQFYGTFGAAELSPVIHRQAQVDHGRVKADQFDFETKFLTRSFGCHGT